MRQKSVTVKQIQNLDRIAIEKIGISSLWLMENAGSAVTAAVLDQLKGIKNPRVCVLCGIGNNAGDGFVVARQLVSAGIRTVIYVIGSGKSLKHDAGVNFGILKKLKIAVKEIAKLNRHGVTDITQADMVVDAIFGVGLNRKIQEPFFSFIEAANNFAKKIISVDIPSGLDGTTGKIYGICINADITVTFSFIKKGFLKNQGPSHVGKTVVADIGIPAELKKNIR